MSQTVTLSFAAPIDLAIQMDLFMETHGLNRSQLIKAALISFLNSQKEKESIPEVLNIIHQEILDIKNIIKKEAPRHKNT